MSMTNTGLRDIVGAVFDDDGLTKHTITVRFTSDSAGETISLAISEVVMLVVPFEPVAKLIEETRALNRQEAKPC